MPSQLGRAHRQLGRMYLPMGRFIEARREMELAYHYAVDNDSVPMSKLVALELMRLRLKTGEDATDLLVETQQLLTDLKAFPVGLGGDNYSLALAAIVAIEAGELDLARQWLEEANEIWRQIGARQNLAGPIYCWLIYTCYREMKKLPTACCGGLWGQPKPDSGYISENGTKKPFIRCVAGNIKEYSC